MRRGKFKLNQYRKMSAPQQLRLSIRFLVVVLLLPVFHFAAALAQRPELVVQTGHERGATITSLAFSPDCKLLASASGNVVKIWDVATGKELRSLTHRGFGAEKIAFNGDGKGLFTAGLDRIILWNITTGKPIWTISDVHRPVAFSANGTIIATPKNGEGLLLLDGSTGARLRNLLPSLSPTSSIVSDAFSPDKKMICIGGYDGELQIVDILTGSLIRSLPNQKHSIDRLRFSADGKILLSVTGAKIDLWQVSTGKLVQTLTSTWDKQEVNVAGLSLSPDGRTIAVTSGLNKVMLSDTSSGKLLRTLQYDEDSYIQQVEFSGDGKTLLGTSSENIFFWDLAANRIAGRFQGHTNRLEFVNFSPDGKTIVTIGDYSFNNLGSYGLEGQGHPVTLWTNNGHGFHFLEGRTQRPTAVFTADGRSILTIEPIKQAEFSLVPAIKKWDVGSAAEMQTFPIRLETGDYLLSPDARSVAVVDSDSAEIKVFDAQTAKQISTIKGHSDRLNSYAFSRDGRLLAIGSLHSVKLSEVKTGKLLRTIAVDEAADGLAFNADASLLAAQFNNSLRIWQVSEGKESRLIEDVISNGGGINNGKLAFSPNGRLLACATRKQEPLGGTVPSADHDSGEFTFQIALFEIATGQRLRSFAGHQKEITALAFSPDGVLLVSGSSDAQTKLWEVNSGQELLTLLTFDQKDWLVVSPEGLFDGSPAAWQQIFWRFDDNTFNTAPIEAFFNEFYYPDLLADILSGKRPRAKSDLAKLDRRQPQLSLSLAENNGQAALSTRRELVHVSIDNAPAGAHDVRLFRNGSLVQLWPGAVKLDSSRRAVLSATVSIVAGDNHLTAYAFNDDNVKSVDAQLTVSGAESLKRPGILYLLMVGVGQYANSQYNLNYPVVDAEDFSAEVKRQQEKLGRYQHVEVMPLFNQVAAKANILAALKTLATISQPEDGVVVYFSGHGTAQGERFYLIAHDLGYTGAREKLSASDLQVILDHSLSDLDLEKAFRSVDAGQLLLVIDACNSGQALEAAEKRRGPMNTKGLAQLAYEKGMYVLTASQSVELAFESEALKHSYLTFALIEEGLKTGAADFAPADGQVLLREWLDFATERVPRMREELVERSVKGQGKALELVEVSEQGKVQTPRVFYRRDTDTQPWIVARPK